MRNEGTTRNERAMISKFTFIMPDKTEEILYLYDEDKEFMYGQYLKYNNKWYSIYNVFLELEYDRSISKTTLTQNIILNYLYNC